MIYFYQPDVANGLLQLMDEEHQHCTKVLRKNVGEIVGVFDGKGMKYEVRLVEISRNHSSFEIISSASIAKKPFNIHIAIAPTKNIDRIEWFVEKACELGVDEISFILTSNCERKKLRLDRLEKKAVSALKQSKSGFLTKINSLIKFKDFVSTITNQTKYIAVVEDHLPYLSTRLQPKSDTCILIGPEGDFSASEVGLAVEHGVQKISLGKSTLRTETAGLMAGHFVNVANHY